MRPDVSKAKWSLGFLISSISATLRWWLLPRIRRLEGHHDFRSFRSNFHVKCSSCSAGYDSVVITSLSHDFGSKSASWSINSHDFAHGPQTTDHFLLYTPQCDYNAGSDRSMAFSMVLASSWYDFRRCMRIPRFMMAGELLALLTAERNHYGKCESIANTMVHAIADVYGTSATIATTSMSQRNHAIDKIWTSYAKKQGYFTNWGQNTLTLVKFTA